jgi:hypothetical protein
LLTLTYTDTLYLIALSGPLKLEEETKRTLKFYFSAKRQTLGMLEINTPKRGKTEHWRRLDVSKAEATQQPIKLLEWAIAVANGGHRAARVPSVAWGC